MRNYIKSLILGLVTIAVSSVHAGSYEDFFRAVIRDDPSEIHGLLQRGFDPNTPDPKGFDGLFIALREDSLKVAGALVDWPATRVETRTADDESPLMMACLHGHLEMAKRLIERGADVNKPGWTPLHYAATNGHTEVMSMLLDQSAYIDAESPNGTTPLMLAAMYGTTASVKLLLEAGADPSLRNQAGMTALDFAKKGSRPDAIQILAAVKSPPRPSTGRW